MISFFHLLKGAMKKSSPVSPAHSTLTLFDSTPDVLQYEYTIVEWSEEDELAYQQYASAE